MDSVENYFSLFQLSLISTIPRSLEVFQLFQGFKSFWSTSSFPCGVVCASPEWEILFIAPIWECSSVIYRSPLMRKSHPGLFIPALSSGNPRGNRISMGREVPGWDLIPSLLRQCSKIKENSIKVLGFFMHTKAAGVCSPWGSQMLLVSY